MARARFKLDMLQDFSGGLNLRSDQFNLAPSESPAMLNVDVDPRGGIKMRLGVSARNGTALNQDVTGLAQFTPDGGTARVIAAYGTTVAESTTDNFTTLSGVSVTSGDRMYGQTTNSKFYGVSGTSPSFVYDGTTASNLASNVDGSPGNYPLAKYTCHWNNHAWVAHTTESGTAHPSRVRWSKMDDPESWREFDYVDVNVGERGDELSGLVPFADRMLVFKTNSVHALYGYSTESFQLVALTQDVGSVSASSPVSTPYGVYFWYDRQGVWVYDGQQFVWVFEKLQPAIDDGRLQFGTPPQLAWFKNRLYVSVDWDETSGNNPKRRVLIYDPTLGATGAWTMTDIDANVMLAFAPPNAQQDLLAGCEENTGRVIHLEQNLESDFYGSGSATHIDSSYTSSWLVGGNPIVRKRWGKPRIVVSSDNTVALTAKLYVDYNSSDYTKEMPFGVQTETTAAATWDSGIWAPDANASTWAGEPNTNITNIERLPTLGTAKAIQMKIDGPTSTDEAWEVNAMAFTYSQRRLR